MSPGPSSRSQTWDPFTYASSGSPSRSSRARTNSLLIRHTHVGVRAALATLAVLLLASCSRGSDDAAKPTKPTTTTTEPPTTTTAPTTTTTTAPQPTPGACPTPPPRSQPDPNRPRYTLTANVDLAANQVTGRVSVVFTPDKPTDRLIFRLWPNGPRLSRYGSKLDIGAVTTDNAPAQPQRPDPTTLVVPKQLAAGQQTTATVDYVLTIPGPNPDRISRSGDSVRLGSFFPILSWEPGVGWATEPPTAGFAEASLSTNADFTATVTAPPNLNVIATGTTTRPDNTYTAANVPDFALSIGRFDRRAANVTKHGVTVTVAADAQVRDDPTPYLRSIVASLDDFHDRYGPYPWPTYTVAITPNLRGGIEYPMHVMQGPGSGGRTTPHEVAHMWFYGLVGSNQGRTPALDEGLATWAEARHQNTLARFRAYTIPAAGRGQAGRPMTFWESRQAAYYRSVYVQPLHALAALGPPDLVDCALKVFVARYAHRVATPKDLIDTLALVFPDAAATLARFGITA